jgi:predicted MPP superfamily phosphohydrolase
MFASIGLVLAAAPLVIQSSARPRMGVIPVVAVVLFAAWLLLLRWALPGFGRRLLRVFGVIAVLTVLLMLPRVLWRWAGAPAGWVIQLHQYLLGPATVVQVAMLAGLVTAPVWVPLGRLVKRWLRKQDAVVQPEAVLVKRSGLPQILTRRSMLQTLPWVLPGGAMVGASYGVLIESSQIVLRRVRIAVPGLPPELHGFRIGQVTDIHISRFQTQLRHLERGLELLAREKLDLLCPTGDLCDEFRLHLDTLRLIKQVPARLGHIACVGNHELYLADASTIRHTYERAQIQLLEEDSVLVGGLRLAGVGFAHSGVVPRLDERLVPGQLERALQNRRSGEPTVLLAHHPHVFRHVEKLQVALQLSGHTHGGQVGLLGKSLLSPVYPLIRGHYRTPDQATQLFVSAGLGHWLPFRFGCPPEVVVIELVPA